MKKASAVLSFLMLAGLLIAGCAAPGGQPQAAPKAKKWEGQVLRLAQFGGVFQEARRAATDEAFEQETGATIEYVIGTTPTHIAKMLAAKGKEPPFDLVNLDNASQNDAIALDLLEPLDTSKLSNISKVWQPITQMSVKGYSPGYMTMTAGIGYNVDKFKELGLKPPTTWDILFEPKLAGRVVIPELGMPLGRPFVASMARHIGKTEKDFDAVLEKLSTLKLYYVQTSAPDLDQRFVQGDVWAGVAAEGRMYTLKDKGFPVDWVRVKGGDKYSPVNMDTVDIVKGSKIDRELAYNYINRHFAAKDQVTFAKKNNYGPTTQAAWEELEKDPVFKGRFPGEKEVAESLRPDIGYMNKQLQSWVDKFNRAFRR